MNFLLLALKSLLIAAASLLLLRLMRNRSAAQRSTVAHLGLIALLLVPVSHFALPAIALTAPRSVTAPLVRPWEGVALLSTSGPPVRDSQVAVALQFPWRPLGLVATAPGVLRSVYLLAALILLAQTFVAMLGLMRLRTRAEVLVDPLWLTALARAQRRRNFNIGPGRLLWRGI
jgi:bla regulator protein BlaR1